MSAATWVIFDKDTGEIDAVVQGEDPIYDPEVHGFVSRDDVPVDSFRRFRIDPEDPEGTLLEKPGLDTDRISACFSANTVVLSGVPPHTTGVYVGNGEALDISVAGMDQRIEFDVRTRSGDVVKLEHRDFAPAVIQLTTQ